MEIEIEKPPINNDINNNNINITIDVINTSINNLSTKFKELNIQDKKNINYDDYQKYKLVNTIDNIFVKNVISKKYSRIIEYISKLISSKNEIKFKKIKTEKNDIIFKVTKLSLYIIKNNINNKKNILNEKFFKTLIIMIYSELLPINNFITIINIFLNSSMNIIINEKQIIDNDSLFKNSSLYFINDLFNALTTIPKNNINDKIHMKLIDELINALENVLFSFPFNLDLNKLSVWFKLLGNKIINFDYKSPIYNKMIKFLVRIYKYNYQKLFYHKYFYEKSAISFDYYINSLDFLSSLFREEEDEKIKRKNKFQIKNGFYIYNNIYLSLNKIQFKLNDFSIIFSFRITKIENDNDDIILFNLENYEQHNIVLRLLYNNKKHHLKLIDYKQAEFKVDSKIDINTDYLVCLSSESKTFGKKNIIYLNEEVYEDKSLNLPNFDQYMTLDLGKKNFEGIFGEVLIIDKYIKKESIFHLYNLKENYADIISSINFDNSFTMKNKKYSNDNKDIIFFKNLKYQCTLKILTLELHKFLKRTNHVIIQPYGKLNYINKNDNNYKNLNIKLYSMNYSLSIFINEHWSEYLIFQLHRIISLSESDVLLNYYLYKTLFFVYEYIKMASDYIFQPKDYNKFKIEKKYTNFILSLLVVFNTKKRKLQFDENIINILLDFCKIYNKKKRYDFQTINFSILLDRKIFKIEKLAIYDKIFDKINNYINNEKGEKQLLDERNFYKLLLLDDILESNEIKHKNYMKIISYYIIPNNISKNKEIKSFIGFFIQYLSNIKSPKKIYHYLKILYLKSSLISSYFKNNNIFRQFITNNSYKIFNNNINCKYCQNIQILSYLIREIVINNRILKNEILNLDNLQNIKKPNYKFIKCLFIQYFNITDKKKLKFIKTSKIYENEIKHITEGNKFNILSLLDCEGFIPKLNNFINYIYFIYNNYLLTKNNELEIIIKKGINLIIDFLEEICNLIQNEYNKENQQELKTKFINMLFTKAGIKILFILYFNINEKEEIDFKKMDKLINDSIEKISNPFYFHLLLPDIKLNGNKEINNYIKGEIVTNINIKIKAKIKSNKKNESINNILIINSIIFLIRIYHNIHYNTLLMSPQLKEQIYDYLKYIIENQFLYSKYIFNINLKEQIIKIEYNNTNIKIRINKKENNEKEYKFLPEIILDLFFDLLEQEKDPDLIILLNSIFKLKEIKSLFFEIDSYFFSEEKKDKKNFDQKMISLLNSKNNITEYYNGIDMNKIIYSLYFLSYFINKKQSLIENEKEENTLLNDLINNALEILFKNSNLLFNNPSSKITKNKNKIVDNYITFKIYDIYYNNFSSNSNKLDFHKDKGNDIYLYFTKLLQSKNIKDKIQKIQENNYTDILAKTKSNFTEYSLEPQKKGMRKNTYIQQEIIFQNEDFIEKKSIDKNENNYFIRSNSQFFNQNEIIINKEKNNIKEDKMPIFDDIQNNKKDEEILSKENNCDNCKDIRKSNLKTSELDDTKNNSTNFNTEPSRENDLDHFDNEDSIIESEYNNKKKYNNNLININKEKNVERNKSFVFSSKTNSISSQDFPNYFLTNDNELNSQIEIKNANNKTSKCLLIKEDENIINEVDVPKIQKIDEHQIIYKKLQKIDTPNYYYKKFSHNESKWTRIIYEPKRIIFKTFGFVFKNYIFYNRRFIKLKNLFKIKYQNKNLERSIPEEDNYCLNYPSKLKNFICQDYYKPFLKPMLNFFENEYFVNSHSFVKNIVVQNDIDEMDQFRNINYEKFNLDIKTKNRNEKYEEDKEKQKSKIKCENISNKGSIFGYIYFGHSLMIFKDKSDEDNRLSEDINNSMQLFYLFSSDKSDRLKNRNKNIIIYYSEIEEIILRKFCFTEIAYEIFMKDGRSYFFNFFGKKNKDHFFELFILKVNEENIKIKSEKLFYYKYDHNYIDIKIINDPSKYFGENEYKYLYKNSKISNFQYLLLVNKFSSRSYNECNQYPIFPLLYMDAEKKRERDLSKAICLNKDLDEEDLFKFHNNYTSLGYHFSSHYFTVAYIIYYLVRLIPFTYNNIKLQSGSFDSASRMFSSLKNLLFVFEVSDENRELCPELFYSYESLLNLNYNNFGFSITNKKQIHHFNTNQDCGIVQFIIDSRNLLEKKELSGWINNIFGCNQLNNDHNLINKFPDYSYGQLNNFNNEKEILYSLIGEEENTLNQYKKNFINNQIKKIKYKIELLSLGQTPSQLFKYIHPKKSKKNNIENMNSSNIENDTNISLDQSLKNEIPNSNIINKYLIEFLKNTNFENLACIFNINNNNNKNIKIAFLFKNVIELFNFYNKKEKGGPTCLNIKLPKDLKIIKIRPYNNIIVELYDNIFLLCRLQNRILLLISEKQYFFIEWTCIVTAIEFYSHEEILVNQNTKIHINNIILGDEEGSLSLIEIKTVFNYNKKECKLNELKIIHKRYKAFYSYINKILYNKRLNIIISSCNDGFISINNGFSFEILNIIEIENSPHIINFKISEYDLLYIYTKRGTKKNSIFEMYCYTLNGIKVSTIDCQNELIDFYIYNNGINAICKNGIINTYDCVNLKQNNLAEKDIKDLNKNGVIKYSLYIPKLQNIFMIFINKEYKLIKVNNEI